jgi:hypothetical protein
MRRTVGYTLSDTRENYERIANFTSDRTCRTIWRNMLKNEAWQYSRKGS